MGENAHISSTLTRKLNKVLEISLEDEDVTSAIQYLGGFYKSNTIQARRNLRGSLEKRSLETHHQFFREFSKVNEQLRALQNVVNELNTACETIDDQLQKSKSNTSAFLQRAHELNGKIKELDQREKSVAEFLQRYQLTREEKEILSNGKIDARFFDTLSRVHTIHNDCKALLRTQQQKAGLEIMEEMSQHQDMAYERLYRWVQGKSRQLAGTSDSVAEDLELELKRAISAFTGRRVLLKCCLDEIVAARKDSLSRRFFDALTRGGVSGTPRPIEMQAHDPLRYMGDILAWVHQAAASEKELIDSLISEQTNREMEQDRKLFEDSQQQQQPSASPVTTTTPMSPAPASMTTSNSSILMRSPTALDTTLITTESVSNDTIENANAMLPLNFSVLSDIFEALSAQIRVRVEQITKAEWDFVVFFRLAHVLEFYSHTIGKIIGFASALPVYLLQLRNETMRLFFKLLNDESEKILSPESSTDQTPSLSVTSDLTPPEALQQSLRQLVDIMSTYSRSVIVDEVRKELDFADVLTAILDPLLAACKAAANQHQKRQQMSTAASEVSLSSPTSKASTRSSGSASPFVGPQSPSSAAAATLTSAPEQSVAVDYVSESYVFLINCYYAIQNVLVTFTFTTGRVEQVGKLMDQSVELLIQHQTKELLKRCGLFECINTLKEKEPNVPLSSMEGMDELTLSESIRTFYAELFAMGSQLAAPQQQCEHLISARLRVYTQNRTASALADAYAALFKAIHNAANGYQHPNEVAFHSPQQIRTLLDIN